MNYNSKNINLTPNVCADSLKNGTVQILVAFLHSHNIYQPADQSHEEMINKYMKDANLKRNISKALKDIVECDQKVNRKMNYEEHSTHSKHQGSDQPLGRQTIRDFLAPICDFFSQSLRIDPNYPNLSIFKILEKIRFQIDLQYRQSSEVLLSQKFGVKFDFCIAFNKSCYDYVRIIHENSEKLKDLEIFEQLGGLYVLIDILQVHYTFHNHSCLNEHCLSLISRTVELILEFSCGSNSKHLCRQLAYSPLHIKIFINLIRNNGKNQSIVEFTSQLLHKVFTNIETLNLNTLQKCQAITSLAEIMMQTEELSQFSYRVVLNELYYILSFNEAARREFYETEGAVASVLSVFGELFHGLSDFHISARKNNQDIDHDDFAHTKFTIIRFMSLITFYLFRAHPEVQDLYWNAEVSMLLVKIVKFVRVSKHDFYNAVLDSSPPTFIAQAVSKSFMVLFYMLEFSPRERIKVRKFLEVWFLRNILKYPAKNESVLEYAPLILNLLKNE